jgi:hypothetical protein
MIRPMRSPATPPSPTNLAALAFALAATVSAVGACKSSREKTAERVAEEPAGQIQLTEAGVVMTTDAGVVSLGPGSKIPDDFPKTVPVYPGAKVNLAARSAAGKDKTTWSLSLQTGDEQPKVVAFYASSMSAGKFTKASDLPLGDPQMTIWQSAQYDVTLMIAAAPENQTTITVTVSAK